MPDQNQSLSRQGSTYNLFVNIRPYSFQLLPGPLLFVLRYARCVENLTRGRANDGPGSDKQP
jgi:hypothetical protein